MTMPGFNEPGSAQTQDSDARYQLLPKNVVGHLLLIWSVEYIQNSPTKYAAPGKEEPVVVVDVVDLCHSPEVWRKQWWRPLYLVGALKENAGKPGPVIAVMKLGQATKGNPPFELESMSQNPRAVEMAQRWYTMNLGFQPSRPEPPQQQAPAPNGGGWSDPWAGMPVPTTATPPAQQSWQQPIPSPAQQSWSAPPAAAAPPQQPLSQQSILDRLRGQGTAQASSPPDPWGADAPPLPPPDQGQAPF